MTDYEARASKLIDDLNTSAALGTDALRRLSNEIAGEDPILRSIIDLASTIVSRKARIDDRAAELASRATEPIGKPPLYGHLEVSLTSRATELEALMAQNRSDVHTLVVLVSAWARLSR